MKTLSISSKSLFNFTYIRISLVATLLLTVMLNPGCKKGETPPSPDACFNSTKVNEAYTKVTSFLTTNEPAYKNGTLDPGKIGLYIDILATQIRMEYYINIISLGPGVKVTNDDGSQFTIDELLVSNYKEALCNETDDVNKKL